MKKKILFVVFVVIIFGGLGYYIISKKQPTLQPAAPDIALLGQKTIQGLPLDKIEKLETPMEVKFPAPDINKPLVILAEFDSATKEIVTNKIKEISNRLKGDNNLFDDWLSLGIYRKMIGDMAGAVEAWEYAGKIRPANSVSFNNLGDLYGYYLKDFKKAEENFLIAIKNEPNYLYSYIKTFDFYKEVMKDDAKAKAILEKGISANPGPASLDLQNLLKNY